MSLQLYLPRKTVITKQRARKNNKNDLYLWEQRFITELGVRESVVEQTLHFISGQTICFCVAWNEAAYFTTRKYEEIEGANWCIFARYQELLNLANQERDAWPQLLKELFEHTLYDLFQPGEHYEVEITQ